jgi:hypothetical protein
MGMEMALSLQKREQQASDLRDKSSRPRENPFRSEDVKRHLASLAMVHAKYVAMKKSFRTPDASLELAREDLPQVG